MKTIFKLFLLTCSLFISYGMFAQGQYDIRFTEYELDLVGMKYYVDIEIKASAPSTNFNIANQTYRFSIDNLANPQVDKELTLSGVVGTSLYAPHNLSGSTSSATFYNVELASGDGHLVDHLTYVKVGRLSYDIIDINNCIDLKLHSKSNFAPTDISTKDSGGSIVPVAEGAYFNKRSCNGLNLYLYLEGAYSVVSKKMSTRLNELGVLPGQTPIMPSGTMTPAGQPYNTAPWNYTGTESLTNYPTDVVDWVLIELREDSTSASAVWESAGLLNSEGRVQILSSTPLPSNHPNPLYVYIAHRNHFPVFLKEHPIDWAEEHHSFDLRTELFNPVLAEHQPVEASPSTGTYVVLSGDVDKVSVSGGADINGTDLVLWSSQNGTFNTYLQADINLDGESNALDKIFISNNNGTFSAPIEQ